MKEDNYEELLKELTLRLSSVFVEFLDENSEKFPVHELMAMTIHSISNITAVIPFGFFSLEPPLHAKYEMIERISEAAKKIIQLNDEGSLQ